MIPDWEYNCVFLANLLKDRHSVLFANLHEILTDCTFRENLTLMWPD